MDGRMIKTDKEKWIEALRSKEPNAFKGYCLEKYGKEFFERKGSNFIPTIITNPERFGL